MSHRCGWLLGLIASGFVGCSNPWAGGQTGSPTDDGSATLVKCETDADCTSQPDAYRCADAGYCVDRNGDPVRVQRGDAGSSPADDVALTGDGGTAGSSAQPDAMAGAGGSGGAGGHGGIEPVSIPPSGPVQECPATLPEPEAACDPKVDTACRLGGFACSCQCQCVSDQGGGTDCFEPCNWRCQYDAFDSLLASPDVAIDIACDAASPENSTITASATITYAAGADDPSLSIDAASGMYLEFEGIGSCTLDTVPDPAAAGPVATGDTLTVTHVNGPAKCLGGGGAIGYFCPKLCNAGARVGFTLKVAGGGAATTQYQSWFLGDGPRGSVFTAHCTP